LALASALAAPAFAADGAPATPSPATPSPETGVLTPSDSTRDALGEYPSASVSGALQCAGQGGSTLVNGASVPTGAADTTPTNSVRSAAAPTMVNGAAVPTSVAAVSDPTWCEGAYRRDAGTNFGQ